MSDYKLTVKNGSNLTFFNQSNTCTHGGWDAEIDCENMVVKNIYNQCDVDEIYILSDDEYKHCFENWVKPNRKPDYSKGDNQ